MVGQTKRNMQLGTASKQVRKVADNKRKGSGNQFVTLLGHFNTVHSESERVQRQWCLTSVYVLVKTVEGKIYFYEVSTHPFPDSTDYIMYSVVLVLLHE